MKFYRDNISPNLWLHSNLSYCVVVVWRSLQRWIFILWSLMMCDITFRYCLLQILAASTSVRLLSELFRVTTLYWRWILRVRQKVWKGKQKFYFAKRFLSTSELSIFSMWSDPSILALLESGYDCKLLCQRIIERSWGQSFCLWAFADLWCDLMGLNECRLQQRILNMCFCQLLCLHPHLRLFSQVVFLLVQWRLLMLHMGHLFKC